MPNLSSLPDITTHGRRRGERERREREGKTRWRGGEDKRRGGGEGERRGSTQGGGEVREKHAFRKHESRQKTYNVNSNILFCPQIKSFWWSHRVFFILETHKLFSIWLLICINTTQAICCKFA